MSVLKIGVVEDELIIGRTIVNTLEELGYGHCGPAINYTEAMAMMETEQPDLLLLDIQLSGKKDGFDVAQQLNDLYQVPFIFLTANSDGDTIEKAKAVKPHAYIVKPFTKEELFAAIEIAFSNYTARQPEPAEKTTTPQAVREYVFVKDGYVFRKIPFSELSYLESDANYVTLHLSSQKKVMVRSTLQDLMAQLDAQVFHRVHRSFAVNVQQIEDVSPTEVTVNSFKVPLGKSYRDELLRALGISDE